MKRTRTRLSAYLGSLGGILLVTLAARHCLSADPPADEWKAPHRAAVRKNPIPVNADSLAAGKKVYAANCLACHGIAGKGDGPAAVALNPKPRNLSDPKTASESDGELFWKITEGRKPMPSYEKLLSDPQRWQVINYIRSFSKGDK